MDRSDLIKTLSDVEALETWSAYCLDLEPSERKSVYLSAEKLWIQRMAKKGKLFVHPDVLEQLEAQSWEPTDLQKRMIWASVIASAEGPDSKLRFQTIKSRLLKKYGRDWWEDVFKRKTNAFAAKERIRKAAGPSGSAIEMLANNTILFSSFAAEERDASLRMIPKN